jgi:endoglucanase
MEIHIFLIAILMLSLVLNFIYFTNNKTAIQIVDEMGLGYNFGKTYNCCSSIDEENIFYDQIKTWGTILPTKKMIKKIKKYGFKTIRFQIIYTNLTDIINSEWLIRVEEIVNWIIKDGMYCILCVNHDKQFWISEGQYSKNKYINFWKQVSNQFIDNDEHLIFETLTDIDRDIQDLFLLNFTQDFIDTIRNSDGFNKERLLIIPEMSTEYEINNYYKLDIPQDPSNKTAVSLHYYFPFEILDEYEIEPLDWYDKFGFLYEALPITKWGSEYDYKQIMEKMELLKSIFINNGIPVILGEVGILSKYNSNISSNREFLYTLFSLTKEINGIMACLWDNSEKISEYNNYYNRETNIWNDEIIRKNIFKISKDNELKLSDYYITTNLEVIYSYLDFYYSNISNKKLLKIIINAKIFGIIGIDFDILITYVNKENKWIDLFLTKKEGKKQYDGTTTFKVDVSSEDLNNEIYVMILEEEVNKNIFINKVTFEYKEYFTYFDYASYKNSILKELN